jgi:hypothetical protein
MLHTLQYSLGITLLVSSAMSYHTIETFISDFLEFQKQAAPPAAVGAFMCWRQGMPHYLSTGYSYVNPFNPKLAKVSYHSSCRLSLDPQDKTKFIMSQLSPLNTNTAYSRKTRFNIILPFLSSTRTNSHIVVPCHNFVRLLRILH